MLAKLSDWFDHRTGYRSLVRALLIEHIPGGAKWRYVWGSTLAFVFSIQLITGILLMTSYSAGDSTAWSSVYFIQYEMDFGWLIRGLHHFGSATMVVLLGLHMLQVVIAGAHLPPREINWWLGLALMILVLGMSLTGYLLPWDQKGYWATQVATNIAGNIPPEWFGQFQQKIIIGGPSYGHQTLTRFYALHVGVLPPLIIVLIVAHLCVFRRHGVTVSLVTIPRDEEGEPLPAKGDGWFWPDQAFKDMIASLVIFGILLTLVIFGHGHKIDPPPGAAVADAAPPTLYEKWAHGGRDGRGANLDSPADPSRAYPARPEWYFLFLFQLLKYFEGEQELIGTVFIPFGVLGALALLPLFGYGPMRKFGHYLGILVVIALLVGVGTLTYLAIAEDAADSPKSKEFRDQMVEAEKLAHRSIQLASAGIPAEGAIQLLRRDPQTRGLDQFAMHCATCHTHAGIKAFEKQHSTASDLSTFGSKDWVLGLLKEPEDDRFFGRTKLRQMSNWVKARRTEAKKKGEAAEKELEADYETIAGWLGEHPTDPLPAEPKAGDTSKAAQVALALERRKCLDCHPYRPGPDADAEIKAPDFTGYGSADWIRLMIAAPEHPLRYGKKNTMPIFRNLDGIAAEVARTDLARLHAPLLQEAADEKAKAEVRNATKVINLSDVDRELIIRWLLKDDRIVFGGDPISGAPKP